MRRPALIACVLFAALTAPASAHNGNPNYESIVTAVPGAPGLKAEMLNGDDRLALTYTGKVPLVVEGYSGEPYLRLMPDGTVQQNQRSEATYLNTERDGVVKVPATADPKATPAWTTVARNGRVEFHDHRAHWMLAKDPEQVTDKGERTKVFDWKVPLRSGTHAATIQGTLFWRGEGGGMPVGALVAFALVALGGVAVVVVVRRRRRAAEPALSGAANEDEAW